MAKRRSPYEIEPLSASIHVASDTLAKQTHKKKKSSGTAEPDGISSSSSFNSERGGNQEKQRAAGAGLALVTDAERDVMNAVDAKLAALASSGSHSTSLKRKQQVAIDAGRAREESSSPATQQQVRGVTAQCISINLVAEHLV